MDKTADITFTVLAGDDVWTNALTPVSAVPWPDRYESNVFPYTPVDYSKDRMIWDFGDGTTYRGVSAEHVYKWPGEYKIKLIIIDETGEPVTSTKTYNIQAKDFIPTDIQFHQLKDVIDIPVGQKTNPIRVDFRLSWQNFNDEITPSKTCPTGYRHLMNGGKSPASWMCGESHVGDVEPPIYTFNVYASGSNSEPIDPVSYLETPYSHLAKGWSFYSTSPSTSALPVTSLDVTLLDSLTGTSGDPNTYELLYYKFENGEYYPVSPEAEGAVFVGLSGNTSFFYKDDTIKCSDTRSDSIIITVELDETKLFDVDMINKRNLSNVKYRNNKPLIASNIKPRANQATKLSITSNGLNEFPINKNKWQNTDISFTVTIQDDQSFNILDTSTFDYNFCIKLVDSTGTPIDKNNYSITTVDISTPGSYRGILNCSESMSNVQLSASLIYPQTSGYIADSMVGWLNARTSEPSVHEYGKLYRYHHRDKYRFDPNNIEKTMERFILGSGAFAETNGIISRATLSNPGKDMLAPPKIMLTDPTGTGAEIVATFDPVTQNVTDAIVQSGGIKYQSPVLNYIVNEGATPPVIDLTIDNNRSPELIAVSLPSGETPLTVWCLETGNIQRLLHMKGDGTLLLSKPLTDYVSNPGNVKKIILDEQKNPYICTDTTILKIDSTNYTHDVVLNDSGIKGLEIGDNYLFVLYNNKITRHNINDTTITKSYTSQSSINDLIYIEKTTLYIITDTPNIIRITPDRMVQIGISIDLPRGEYSELSTTTDGNVYTIRDNRYLTRIQKPSFIGSTLTSTSELVYDFSEKSYLTSICGDSRGYIWLTDDYNQKIWFVDCTIPEEGLIINLVNDVMLPGQINQTDYPVSDDGQNTALTMYAKGDWTGFQWLQKFGYIDRTMKDLEGTSSLFDIHPESGTYNIRKFNEDHDHGNTLRSYALQPWLNENQNLWESFIVTAVGDKNSAPNDIGKYIYEKISNFIPNNNDIDDCNIDTIHSYSMQYSFNDIQQYNLNYPPTLKRLVDLCSIKHSRLFGAYDSTTDDFDMFTGYTDQENRKNLGYEVDFSTYMITPGETLVAYEKFSKIFTPIKTSYPLTGDVDDDGNVISTQMDESLVSSETQQYPLSSYTPLWRWGLIAPLTVTGDKILNYYSFWTYNESVTSSQVEGVINWDSPQTLLTPELSSYDDWKKDTGILDNMIEHQLRQGLSNFKLKSEQSYETTLLFEVIGLDTHYFDWTGPCIEFVPGENAIVRFVDHDNDEVQVINEDGFLVWDPNGPGRHKFTANGETITLYYSQTAYTVTFTGFGLIVNEKATT